MRYAIVIEKAPANYAAYVPDLPGCIATSATVAETESLIREAIEFHIEGLKSDGLPIPPTQQSSRIRRRPRLRSLLPSSLVTPLPHRARWASRRPESVSRCAHYSTRPALGAPRRAFSRGNTF